MAGRGGGEWTAAMAVYFDPRGHIEAETLFCDIDASCFKFARADHAFERLPWLAGIVRFFHAKKGI